MLDGKTKSVLQYIHCQMAPPAPDDLSDGELLRRFAACRDETAFQTLLQRHGPIVLRVCRRLLDDRHDAEDAFQATFLVLARKAGGAVWVRSLGSWLYEVAHRLAREARRRAWRRRAHEARASRDPVTGADPLSEITGRELLAVLDEELIRLPERYRSPLVLCCLEGHGGEEAARILGCSPSTLRRRLARGRELLRLRLTRRGITLSSAAIASSLLLQHVAPAAVPVGLARSMARAASRVAAGEPLSGSVSQGAAELAKKLANRPSAAWVKVAASVIVATGMLVAGAGAFVRPGTATAAGENGDTASKSAEPATPVAATEPAKDLLGDPLPPGALARLGTSRLLGHRRLLFSPDGRRLIRDRADGGLQISDVPSGKPLATIRASDLGRGQIVGSTLGFSRDGKYFAACSWLGGCGIWETETGKLVRTVECGSFFSLQNCVFSPDGKLLAVGAGGGGKIENITLGVYEVASGKQLFTTPGSNGVFDADGRSLVAWNAYGYRIEQTARRVAVPGGEELVTISFHNEYPDFAPGTDGLWFFEVAADHSVRAWDMATGEVRHTFAAPADGGTSDENLTYIRHAPGRRELIAVHTKPAGVWCWDLKTGRELWQAELAGPAYFPSLSADGSTLLTGENTGNARVWDVSTGKQRLSFRPGSIGHSREGTLSPDGRMIATTCGSSFASGTAFWDGSTGKLLTDLPGHTAGITAAAFAPDGATVWTVAKDRTLRSWDPANGREKSRSRLGVSTTRLALAPDGTRRFVAGPTGAVQVMDAKSGQLLGEYPIFRRGLIGFALTADGKHLVAAGHDGKEGQGFSIRVCDAATGEKLREFGRSEGVMEQFAVSADGGVIAASFAGRRVVVWDGAGKKLTEQTGRGERGAARAGGEVPYRIGSIGLSPDGRWLAYSDQEAGVVLVDVRTGRETGRAKTGVFYQNPSARDDVRDVLAFSPDGKTVAWSGIESTAAVMLIEVRSAQVRHRLRGDSHLVQQLVFFPDGSKLLSAGPDGSALIWDVFERSPQTPAEAASSERLAEWWKLLAEPNADDAYEAMRGLVRNPSAAVALLREKLKPVKEVEAAKYAALLNKLDGPTFAGREAAARELVAPGDAVEPRLRRTRQKPPSLEVERRIDDILDRIEAARLPSERAVEVLERIGDRSARQLPGEWAAGMPGAARTVDAARAVARMEHAAGAIKDGR